MNSRELRKKFLAFYREKNHAIISSASLIPDQDPTVLFTTAGMHPLKPYLLGQPHPSGTRLANVQKCIRTVDIDNVGDATHITFFEMLGSWSLGDYFKKEAIEWSYEFLTEPRWLNLNPEKLHITIFAGDAEAPRDEESFKLWNDLGIPKDRIYYLPREDNWWGPAGATGPCGPCTEMFYDTGKEPCSETCRPGCHCGKFFEIWNDVFMCYNKKADGTYEKLKQHNVDTGMGVERTIVALNGKQNVFEIDSYAVDRVDSNDIVEAAPTAPERAAEAPFSCAPLVGYLLPGQGVRCQKVPVQQSPGRQGLHDALGRERAGQVSPRVRLGQLSRRAAETAHAGLV